MELFGNLPVYPEPYGVAMTTRMRYRNYNRNKELTMTIRKLACSTAMILAATTAVSAQADSGVYVGGGVASAKIKDSAGNPGGVDFSESDVGLKLFAGYKLDVLPLVKLAAEAGYRDLGKPATTIAGVDVDYRVQGFDYGLLAGVGLGPVDLFGRFGGIQYKLEKNIGGVRNDYDGSAPVYGVGAWFTLFGIGIRAEFEKIDVDELDDVQMTTVSAFYQF